MQRPEEPFIIDVEASGFGGHSYPIEVGVALSGGRRFCSLITPAPDWTYWDEDAENVHHITRDTLESCGKPAKQVARQLNQLLEGKTLYTDGWVVDKPWLTTLFHVAGESMNFSVSPLELILSEKQMEQWHEAKDLVSAESNVTRHRASNDAWIVQQTFRRTLQGSAEQRQ